MPYRFISFVRAVLTCLLVGSTTYYIWVGALLVVMGLGGVSYFHHLTDGLIVTNMNDHVSWGIGIANFVFFVGVAAAAAVLVVPAYAFHREDIKEVALLGELLAVCAVIMCLLFIFTDIGRPDRFWHLVPPLGMLNLPSSLLSWDVLVFNVYLFLNIYVPAYLLYKTYIGAKPWWPAYLPFVFLSMFWAVSIHTVTAFLMSGLASRPFWNSAILAPRFLISAFASGPAILILLFYALRRFTNLKVKESVIRSLVSVLRVTMPINLFLFGCDLFTEFYPGATHNIHARYLYLGVGEHNMLTKFIWTAISMNIVATAILQVRWLRENKGVLITACLITIGGIWTEKGMGLIFPGFTPDPLGQFVEYVPNGGEVLVNFAVVALGALMFTLMGKVAIAIQTGEISYIRPLSEILMKKAHKRGLSQMISIHTEYKPIPPWAQEGLLKRLRARLGRAKQ